MPSKNPPTTTRAPGVISPVARRLPSSPGDLGPRVDDRLVRPETREEQVRGGRILANPANPPHGDTHCQVDGEALFHIRSGYIASTDLLTRVNGGSDFATDTSIRREGKDETTGARHLEELVFEVIHEQSLRDITERAEQLSARGIRRIFGIFVKRGEVTEWSPDERTWRVLPPEAEIEDACFLRPLPVRALLDRAEGRNAVARVLLDENNPVIEQAQQQARHSGRREGLAEGRREGLAEGRREAIGRLCQIFGIALTGERQATLACLGAAALDVFADRIARERSWPS